MTRDVTALIAFIDGRAAMPFAWGRRANDCVSYAAGAVAALTGVDPLPADIGSWSTERGALRILRRHGGLLALTDRLLTRTHPALALRGDIACIVDPDPRRGIGLMVVEGETLVGPGEFGNERLPRSAMTFAWSAAR